VATAEAVKEVARRLVMLDERLGGIEECVRKAMHSEEVSFDAGHGLCNDVIAVRREVKSLCRILTHKPLFLGVSKQ